MWKLFSVGTILRRYSWLFVLMCLPALVVALLAPRGARLHRQFSVGKPWQYELLTAPYDFPIYKSEEALQHDQDSVRASVRPVYAFDGDLGDQVLQEFADDYKREGKATLPIQYYSYLEKSLREVYGNGLMQKDDRDSLRAHRKLVIYLIRDGEKQTAYVTKLYDLKEAYTKILDDAPASLDRTALEKLELSRYLKSNIGYDAQRTAADVEDALGGISLSTGMVQAGERIIGLGELVTPETYNILLSLEREQSKKFGSDWDRIWVKVGIGASVAIVLSLLSCYLVLFTDRFKEKRKNFFFLLISIMIFVLLTEINASGDWFHPSIIPYVMVVIMMRIFFDSHTAFVSYVVCLLCSAIFVNDPLPFFFIQLSAGLVALLCLQTLTSRAQLIRTAFLVYVGYSVVGVGVELMRGGTFDADYWIVELYYAINLIFLMLTYILAFVVEKSFGYISNISLVELSDINTPLMRELSEVAPGTFQHSLQVSLLATEAADKIHADVQLIRTGALYHDIGKIKNPGYFTENQGEYNPHSELLPEESAAIIIRHVTDGIALAQKHNLPPQVTEFIRTHHGRGTAKYFYNTYCNAHPNEVVDPGPFTYPGPNPSTKEMGILMLADSVEASSRSLKEYTDESIRALIDKIVDGIVAEGLLNDTPLTFRDIQQIKEVFFIKLRTMYHSRISYPDARREHK